MTSIQTEENPESILWEVRREHKKGIFRRKVVRVDRVAITNLRVIIDYWSLPLTHISEVAVINKHHDSAGAYTGYNTRTGGSYSRVASGTGTYTFKSKTIGDIILITPVGPDAIITNCADPLGLKSLILSLRKGFEKA